MNEEQAMYDLYDYSSSKFSFLPDLPAPPRAFFPPDGKKGRFEFGCAINWIFGSAHGAIVVWILY